MAIARCENHPLSRSGGKYTTNMLPMGFPDSAVICGREDCEQVARIFLTEAENIDYQNGQRIFSYDSRVAKVKVQ
ncbi:MAG: hypothetical protein ACYCYP_09395 [Leptospirales bacterium]